MLDEDVRHRAAQAARSGFATILADLHPNLRWDGTCLERDAAVELSFDPVPGLVLTPSVFLPWTAVWNGAPGDVLLGYPARGRGAVWSSPSPVLGTPALGARRVALLADLDTPRSTSELASRHRLSPATVSYHLNDCAPTAWSPAARTGTASSTPRRKAPARLLETLHSARTSSR
jgi:hypothetical protein